MKPEAVFAFMMDNDSAEMFKKHGMSDVPLSTKEVWSLRCRRNNEGAGTFGLPQGHGRTRGRDNDRKTKERTTTIPDVSKIKTM